MHQTQTCNLQTQRKWKAPKFTQKPAKKDVKEGTKVKFDATVKGKPLPEVTWYRNEVKLEPTERVNIVTKEVIVPARTI